jgi:hypothetical protein
MRNSAYLGHTSYIDTSDVARAEIVLVDMHGRRVVHVQLD